MLEQHKKFTAEKLPDFLFQTYIYPLVNKKATFQRFGGILSETEWSKFREFMKTWIREEREERAKPNKPYDEVLGAAQFTERTSISCQKLSNVVKSCQKLTKAVKSCHKLLKSFKSCQKLS